MCLKDNTIKIGTITKEIQYHRCSDVNHTSAIGIDAPPAVKSAFLKMLKNRSKAFADPNESLPFNTSVTATIRTVDDDPIYSKLYPYPLGVADFVDSEIKCLLKDGIIRKSWSPYNNPIWVVDKKGTDEMGNKKKRLVMDLREFNQKTMT